ncbi:hypothetical protein EG799_01565 [Aurantiacibacter spongiae]|uniref:Uncharacterized protein n=2 Tax=Aurantiacibacter spongiae TaxID=2488860 RepID=A0A3N5CV37_9SPHN|nr:hypothetical protein EG799_01565 [Aurantiacibacter spongiae]
MLRPANAAAEAAMREIRGRVRVEIRGGVANQRRRGLYWSVAGLVVPLLNEAHDLTLDEQDLHDITRQKLGVGRWIDLPSGDRRFKPASTSNRAMNEAQRSEYTSRALHLWSTWTGVDVTTLQDEARHEAA